MSDVRSRPATATALRRDKTPACDNPTPQALDRNDDLNDSRFYLQRRRE